ncbi:hypothetical protein FQA39_LY07693 [Lamprigera yunnana]|nr:hypothetical protein FQA39_LY07693 [Lamprigera yunnana]
MSFERNYCIVGTMTNVDRGSIEKAKNPELQYEVASRGFSAEHSVAELRKSLGNILKLERDTFFVTVEHDFALAADMEAISAGAKSLGSAIEEFNGDITTNKSQRISTLFCHLFSRGQRIKTTNKEEKAQQRLCLLTLVILQPKCEAKIKQFCRSFPIASPIRALVGSSPAQPTTDAEDVLYSSDSETEITQTTAVAYGSPSRYEPVNK